MAEIQIALLGGDRREMEVARALSCLGRVRCVGLPEGAGAERARDVCEAVRGTDVLVLPMAGVNEEGRLYAPLVEEIWVREEDWAEVRPGVPVLVGVASGYLRGLCEKLGLRLVEVAERDEVARPNAVPTAEGAIGVLMAETDEVVYGMRVLVLGFGRVGEAVALRLRALGAEVCVANRGSGREANARSMGFEVVEWGRWPARLGRCEAVINTVPACLLGREELRRLKEGAVVLDLASGAGGVDWAAAGEMGVRAVHALSLPGKVAPVTAGRILGEVYPRILREVCGVELAERSGEKDGR